MLWHGCGGRGGAEAGQGLRTALATLLAGFAAVGTAWAGRYTEVTNVGPANGCPTEGFKGADGESGDTGSDLHDPITLSTGDFQDVRTDLFIPGRGFDFRLDRMYRSRSSLWTLYYDGTGLEWEFELSVDGPIDTEGPYGLPAGSTFDDPGMVQAQPLGVGWDHSYNIRVKIDDLDVLQYFPGNGRCDDFLAKEGVENERIMDCSAHGEPFEYCSLTTPGASITRCSAWRSRHGRANPAKPSGMCLCSET